VVAKGGKWDSLLDACRELQDAVFVKDLAQELTGVGSFEWDPVTGSLSWSRELFRIFGAAPDSFEPTFERYLDFVHPDDRSDRRLAVERALTEGSSSGLHRIVRPDGEVRWLESRLRVVPDEQGNARRLIGACQDVTERRRSEAELRHQIEVAQEGALIDPLTGIGNRRLALERLAHALALAERARSRVAVLFIDLNAFKQINDEFGHSAGDRVLREVAERLSDALRRSDTLARIGGDEFLVICENSDRAGAARTADRVRAAFDEAFFVRGRPRALAVSIGIAVGRSDRVTAEGLIAAADDAMYAGRDRVP
jgi:diguanylate cyclase (GGDEF)-like protein/PAS domain S-box-containing protein